MNRFRLYCTRIFKISFCIFFLITNLITPSRAQEGIKGFGNAKTTGANTSVKGNTYAIIAGITPYPYIKPLQYGAEDAELFRDFLMSPAGGGLKLNDNIFFKENAEVKWLPWLTEAQGWLKKKNLTENDRLFIYFSGHGDAYEDDYFLLTYDCNPQNDPNLYKATALNMDYLKKGLVLPPLRKGVQVILILDACRSNELPGGVAGLKKFVELAVEPNAIYPGELQMLSTEAGTESYEHSKVGNGHGLFTYYLIDALYGAADIEGEAANNNGKVEFEELSSWVRNKVRKDAMLYFKKEQRPVFKPVEKYSEVISVVDKNSYEAWVKNKELSKLSGTGEMLAINKKSTGGKAGAAGAKVDTVLLSVYNKFIAAIKAETLIGENSAETFYDQMLKQWPNNTITEDARYDLAGELLDFGQQKINLYLSGKGFAQLHSLEERMKKDNIKGGEVDKGILPEGARQLSKMKMVVNTTFSKAAQMMEKATTLLKDEPTLLEAVYPKLYFLKAAAVNNSENKTKLREGVKYARKAMALDKNAAYNYNMMGMLLADLDDDSCEYYYKKAIQLAPKWAYPVNGLGLYYFDNGKTNLALQYYTQAFALDTLNSFVSQNLGSVHHTLNHIDSAKYYYYKALKINDCESTANGNLGSLFIDSIDLGKPTAKHYTQLALSYLKKSLKCNINNTWTYRRLAYLFAKINKPDSAIFYLQKGVEANPEVALAHRNLADELLLQKDTVGAEKEYLAAYKADPDDVAGHLLLGDFYNKTGNRTKAMDVFTDVAKKHPEEAEAYNYMGIAYHKTDLKKALQYYLKAAEIDPGQAYIQSNIGNTYSSLKDTVLAKKYYAKAIEIDSGYIPAYQGWGSMYIKSNQYNKAFPYYMKAYKLDKDNLTTNYNIGHMYRMQDMYDEAIPYYEKTIQLDPNDPDPYHAMGMIFHGKKDLDKAAMYFEKAVKLDSIDSDYYWHLANVNYSRGYQSDKKGDKQTGNKYYDLAIVQFTKGSKLTTTPTDYFAKVGGIYFYKEGAERAVLYYTDLIKQYPQYSAEIYNYTGNIYRSMANDYLPAITYYKKALEFKQTEEIYTGLGYSYLYSGQIAPAIGAFNKSIDLMPNSADCYYNLACAYSIQKNAVKVIQTLDMAFAKGYKNYDHFMEDSDLTFARQLAEFGPLVKKYFPGK
ncbi:tetratricopeptide repeat protein [Mucilaginibacter limnophilus]|uniref:Tetratricopeptide repeat protein n=1 Tax=Mucilaginibacter limnophilus TaxID=1932778 RepID=A0A3S2Y277_9SPHI|nr:tetratricopeptide repeat protein [Mucilaginibacter limnophilus]RVU00131.1 tetratricopeptide repeat protein [Mucilaginibacter limnophilus]